MAEREGPEQNPDEEYEGGDEDQEVIVLTDEEGNEHEFTLIQTLEVDNKDYAILLPNGAGDNDEEEEAAIILRIDQDENDEDVLVEIEDEEEFERVADAWEELLDEDEVAPDEEDNR